MAVTVDETGHREAAGEAGDAEAVDLAARLVALDVRPPKRPRGDTDPRVEREAARYER